MSIMRWAVVGIMALVLSACSVERVRNEDGSLTATAAINEAQFSEEVALALENERVSDVSAALHDGYITISATRTGEDGAAHAISFRLTLGSADGRLTATISQFMVDGQAADETRLAKWNEKIAKRLERQAQRHPNRTLESVSITEDMLTMVWRVVKPEQ